MDEAQIRRRLGEVRVAHLATNGSDGRPHIVPICFVVVSGEIFFAVDQKPKRTSDLRRLRNIAANPHVAVLADHYEEDWNRLWWVRVDGRARVLDAADESSESAIDALAARYPQYRSARPSGPVVSIHIERLSGWSATAAAP